MDLILSEEQRSRFARSASVLISMPAMCDAVDAEVEAVLDGHPLLPRDERMIRILWALAFSQLSQSALTRGAEQQEETKSRKAV